MQRKMKVYDTMARGELELDLPRDRVIKVFVCGPTVQDSFHIGHARTYIFFDSMVKYLRTRGLSVFYLQNITDVDDKIINRAIEEDVPYEKISERYTREYFSLMQRLKVDSVNFYALATRHVQEIIGQITSLIGSGFAYETSDGVYFSVSRFSDFGKLSGQDLDALKHGARVEGSEEKRDPRDFVVWKKVKPGEPWWNSPWGKGRPGWHIEDTAITEKYFGPTYDIHGAGSDLIFPHHEAEIAIERSISGKDHLARYWLHSGMINIDNEKMSKSLKNYVTIRAVLKDYEPEELRFALLNAQFRSAINFSPEMMDEARANVQMLNTLYRKLRLGGASPEDAMPDAELMARLTSAMDSNFDFRSLFRELILISGNWNSSLEQMTPEEKLSAASLMEWVDSFAGILRPQDGGTDASDVISLILKVRRELREKKDFASADSIRSGLRELGIYIEDKGDDTIWWES